MKFDFHSYVSSCCFCWIISFVVLPIQVAHFILLFKGIFCLLLFYVCLSVVRFSTVIFCQANKKSVSSIFLSLQMNNALFILNKFSEELDRYEPKISWRPFFILPINNIINFSSFIDELYCVRMHGFFPFLYNKRVSNYCGTI